MPTEQQLQTQFFEFLFGEQEGYLCIGAQVPFARETHRDSFFIWPKQKQDIVSFIQQMQATKNVYFCVHLLDKAKRTKENALPTRLVWADLDAQKADTIEPHPSLVLESSPGRFHGFWRMALPVSPDIAQDYSRRIAYRLEKIDKSGWDLTQLLRIPYTINHKYDDKPIVGILEIDEEFVAAEEFEKLPFQLEPGSENGSMPPLPELGNAAEIIERYIIPLSRTGFHELYEYDAGPNDDWSRLLWKLINTCLECGLSTEETFTVCFNSGVNKYERDSRPPTYLWRDVLKAGKQQLVFGRMTTEAQSFTMPRLYKDNEVTKLPHYWIDSYSEWACRATDAIPQYHGLAAAIGLSAIVASSVRIDTSFGELVPNLWGMILGDSTLTRKTTAMNMILRMIQELDKDVVFGSDGSVEGLLTALSFRPKQASLFYRDEVSGFFNGIAKKEYLAGMLESLTQLYDSPRMLKRHLRREVIEVHDPVFIFFAAGVTDRVYSSLTTEHVLSGFIPRFLVVGGESDISLIRPTTRPDKANNVARDNLQRELAELYELYNYPADIKLGAQTVSTPARISADLTDTAWNRYGEIEQLLLTEAHECTAAPIALPVFERLSRSLLKLATILAASRKPPKNARLTVDKVDILKAATLIQDWGKYSVDFALNCGLSGSERLLRRVEEVIEKNPGIMRSELMRMFHLTKREADEIFGTLEERGNIRMVKRGKATMYWTV